MRDAALSAGRGLGQGLAVELGIRVTPKAPKPKKCKAPDCGQRFTPFNSLHIACSTACAIIIGKRTGAAKAAKEAKEDRKRTKLAKEAIKTVPMLKKEAQHAFNAFIRSRDRLAGHACICCGAVLQWDIPGGATDAGHFRSTGSADHLRFHEDNCHAQAVSCNRYGAGRAVDYRMGLIARIGLARVEALETNNTAAKWTRNGLREIRDTCRARAAKLAKEMTHG